MVAFFLSGASVHFSDRLGPRADALPRRHNAGPGTVLGVFMAGLAIGSTFGGRLADRTRIHSGFTRSRNRHRRVGLLASFGMIAWAGDLYVTLHRAAPDQAALCFFGPSRLRRPYACCPPRS